MFFELTDLLTCPRCGPGHGLVLLVEEVADRRVRSGWLGCPNCRHDYRVEAGIADLRLEPGTQPAAVSSLGEEELALKVVALSGVAEARGYLLLGTRLARAALEVSELAPEVEVITVTASAPGWEERPGLSPVLADAPFPLADHHVGAVAIAPAGDGALVGEAVRCLAPGGRLVMFDARPDDLKAAERSGVKIVAAKGGIAVGERRLGSLPVVR